ncbi:MAG: RICIN domain-containing protein [Deltaproteobacteria bacterium]|nr:RICIN domain-containing protein [Deltaproteobacteria bacterium]
MRRRIVEGIGMAVVAVFGAACGGEGDIRSVEEALTTNWVQLKAVHSNKCMEVWGSATYNGANVQQWSCHGGDNQKWRFEVVGTGEFKYRVRNKNSSKCLDVAGSGTSNGTNVDQYTCYDSYENQRFSLTPVGGGSSYELRPLHVPLHDKCVEVNGASTANGANIDIWSCDTGNHQRWLIVE